MTLEALPPDPAPARKPWAIMLGAAAGVVVLAGAATAFLQGSDTGPTYADWMPAATVAYVELDFNEMTSPQAKALLEDFGGLIELATGEPFDVDDLAGDLLPSLLDDLDLDLDYEEDIAPWASGTVAGGLVVGDSDEPGGVVWISGGDGAAVSTFLEKVAAIAEDQGISRRTVTVGGVDFIAGDLPEPTVLMAEVNGDLLIVTGEQLAADVLELTPESSLQSVDEFIDRAATLPGGAMITVGADTGGLAGLVEQSMGMLMLGAAAPSSSPTSTPDTGWMVGVLTAAEGQLRFDATTGVDPEFPFTSSPESVALDELPAEAIGFFRAGSLIYGLRTAILSAGPDVTKEFEEMTGITLETVLDLFAVDAAVAVWPSTQPEVPVGVAVIGVGEAEAGPTVEALNQLLAVESGATAEPIPGGYLYEGFVAFGSRGNVTVLSTDRSLLAGAPEATLTAGDTYQRAVDLLGSRLTPQVGIDVDALIDLVDGFVTDQETLGALSCNPVRFLAGGLSVEGSLSKSAVVVEIDTPSTCSVGA